MSLEQNNKVTHITLSQGEVMSHGWPFNAFRCGLNNIVIVQSYRAHALHIKRNRF